MNKGWLPGFKQTSAVLFPQPPSSQDGGVVGLDSTQESGLVAQIGGWIPDFGNWYLSTTDTHTYVVVRNGDVTGVLGIGCKFKCTNQGATQYFFVSAAPTFASGVTTATLYGGTGSSLTATPITNVSFSTAAAPIGFPQDPAVWTESFTDTANRTQTTPVSGTWYNPGTSSLVIPIGIWFVRYDVALWCASQSVNDAQASIYSTLSTANNTELAGKAWSAQAYVESNENTAREFTSVIAPTSRSGSLNLSSKTTYFLNTKTDVTLGTGQTIGFAGANVTTQISATLKWAA